MARNGMLRAFIVAIIAGVVGASIIGPYLLVSQAVWFHTPPLTVLEWDTSNITGMGNAVAAGWRGVPIGQTAHYVVAILWAAVFVVAALSMKSVRLHPLLAGLTFGVLVLLVMSYIVVPLGHAPPTPHDVAWLANNLIAHAVFFGVPLSYTVRRLLG